ncbi:MAG: neuraminidase-like domain-containing protein [Gallionellaceae bacterium]|jgi:hypothetical protein
MRDNSYRISGRVKERETGLGVAGLRVEAWDKDLIFDDLVGSAVTGNEGEFQIEFDESYFAGIFFDRRPDLFFRVFFNDTLVLDTQQHTLWNLQSKEKSVELLVSAASVGLPDSTTPQVIPELKLDELAGIFELDSATLQKLKDRNLVIDQVGEATLTGLVEEGILDLAQKKEIQLVVGLAQLSGENLELTSALKDVAQESPADLVRWGMDSWLSFLNEKKISLPSTEAGLESYAENLRDVVEQSFPSEYFLHRVVNDQIREKTAGLVNTIAPLFNKNTTLFADDGGGPAKYDWSGISEANKTAIQTGLAELSPLVNSYRALGLMDILNHPEANAAQKQSAVEKRFASLATFYANNPAIDLKSADFATRNINTQKDNWNWQGIDEAEQPHVRKQMAAAQRTFNMGEDHATGDVLLKKGYDSAYSITSVPEDDFLERSGLGWEKGKKVYAIANEMATGSSQYYETIRDVTRGDFHHIALANPDTSLVNDLKEIDGYEELFGNQNYCDCEACKSIFSPAAYFTDLMYFVHENVSKRVFIPSQTSHPLYLKRRRPDLWNLRLSCKNTDTEIPYLQVVNEVLEQYLGQVIPSTDVYETLRTADWSTRQPFNLPLEETRLFLSHFDLRLVEIYKTLRLPKDQQYREQLLLSVDELNIIATPNQAGAKKRFGNVALANFNVQEFIRYAGIERTQLDDLLATKFAPAIAQVQVKMQKLGVDIQQYSEALTGLTEANLDIIHRYLRLWKKTDWTLREFDLIMSAMKAIGLIATLEDKDAGGKPKVLQLGQVSGIQSKLGCTPEEMAAIIYRLPLLAVIDFQEPLYRRMFDLKKIFGVTNVDAGTTTTLPALSANDKITPLILAGLGISEAELEMLFSLLGIDTSVDQVLGIDLLSSLYRHALIARGLKLDIEDFVHLVRLVTGGGAIAQLAQIESVADVAEWRKTTSFSVAELLLIIKGEESSDLKFGYDIHTVASAVMEIQDSATKDKKDKVDLLKAYLQNSFNLTAEQLDNEYFAQLLTLNLGSAAITTTLNATFTNATPDTPTDLDGLLTMLHELERYTLLFKKAQFDAKMITFAVNNKEVFGITDFKSLSVSNVINLMRYHGLLDQRDIQRDALNIALQNIQQAGNFSAAENATLADAWLQPASLISSLTATLTFTLPALEAIDLLKNCLDKCIRLGVQGDALLKLSSSDKPGLLAARNVVVGALASKYPDEKTRNEKLEPYNDRLNTLKRDALCDYIISRSDILKFKDRNDLYNFFLLDVEMSGCFRTSYIVAAITSVQLYIHRCLVNLEQSDPYLNPGTTNIKVQPGWIPADEWEWRKNYRVWEANRKVFLYPENYIDPTLRDNKTEIFKELEDELLQQKITQESAEAAYKKYLSQFAELTRLRYAGGYYHHVSNGMGFLELDDASQKMKKSSKATYYVNGIAYQEESDDSLFYLFARTGVHPYQYSYRTYNHNTQMWTSWKTIDLGIEAAEISTVIFQGKLYIYWTEVQGKEVNKIKDGNSTSDGFVFKAYVKYSSLDENGKWCAPQRLYIGQNHVSEETVFRRVWQGSYPSEGTREKAHDTTVEKFQELVFRKPYATIASDIRQPLALQHIWSHNKFQSRVKYTTGNISYILYSIMLFNVPSQEFVVTNNDFSLAVINCNATITIYSTVVQTTAEVRLLNSGYCKITFTAVPVSIVAAIQSQHSELNTPIKTTVTNVSLSRNAVTNLQQSDMLSGAQDISTFPALQREFNEAFSENQSTGYYIESGKITLSNHFVSQTPENDASLLVENGNNYDHVALSTILTDELSDILFAKGLEQFLSLTTQKLTDDYGRQFDFKGAYGDYYMELFFHIPFLIADHLNANQKFKEAKWWYERIFNPTADEKPDDIKKTDHNWQFREFRNLDIQKLKDILTDSRAIEAYKKDPFNPHAIARLRMNAYQKTIVMHYIDNLLDWGDFLFTQDTRESINEAEMLYQMAFDILGKRPVKIGKCEIAEENLLTYANIEPQIAKGSEFLIQLENYYWVQKHTFAHERDFARIFKNLESITGKKIKTQKSFAHIAQKSAYNSANKVIQQIKNMAENPQGQLMQTDRNAARVKSYKKTMSKKMAAQENTTKWSDSDQYIFGSNAKSRFKTKPHHRSPGHALVKQYSTVFCVPPNSDLMKYWGRVEDRLYKIRNCMNIKGMRRSLSLFQPPIDPMLLVRARAAGLSLEDIAALVGGGKLPAYRFTYLIEKAKQYTQTLQSFGSALLSALEKKDGEELLLLRTVHEKNILKLTRNIKKKQLQEAQYQYKVADAALTNVQNRVDYYQGLIDAGLNEWEITEQVSKWTAGGIRTTLTALAFLDSVFGFLPQVGSPFAMKYGGHELKSGTDGLISAADSLAAIADNIAILAGMEAAHQRREQDWKQQLKLSQQEFKQSSIQLLAADIRQQIAEHDLAVHEKNMEQSDELFDFYKNKFTNLGLYNYMASTLNRLYRDAYNIAYELAKQAESAYQHERYDSEIYIQADNWQFDRAGLLSGERLMLQLQALEKKYMDGNERQPEITQTFSLAMLSPMQLLKLRQSGNCSINIPEIAYEMLYPGQYRRTIKSVRISIPCVAGPYINISARLTLTMGSIELDDKAALQELQVAKNTSMSASSANNDPGVFDFNFRDERYLPFEGAGAISEWLLELPANIRAFNYDTISDVLLHVSYTACEGNRVDAENALATLVNDYGTSTGFYRLVSLRYEFPETLYKLFSQDNQLANFELTAAHFPYPFSTKTLTMVTGCMVYLKPKKKMKALVPGTVKINNTTVDWSDQTINIPSGPAANSEDDRIKGGTIALSASPVKVWTIDAGNLGIDKDSTQDVLILIKYKTS